MLENLTKVITRFFGIIAGSLSGISAILIAIGYLAERSQLKMLGFTTIPVDLNQYLYTGAYLVGFLPGIIILGSISLLSDPFPRIVLIGLLFIGVSLRFKRFREFWDKALNLTKSWIIKFKLYLFIFLIIIQLLSLYWMVKAVSLENLLFTGDISSVTHEFTFLKANKENLQQLLLSKDKNEKLPTYYTQLFLNVMLTGLAIYYLMTHEKESQQHMSFHMKFWLTINLILLATQVILLPSNYGVLLLNKKYQEVKVQFISGKQTIVPQEKNMSVEMKNQHPKLEIKIRDQHLEKDGPSFKYDLEASPKAFTDPDGDVLTYSVSSDKPNIVGSSVDHNMLTIYPLQKGKSSITVEARDSEGLKSSTNFNVDVVDDIPWGSEKGTVIPSKTLIAGGEPFIRDLIEKPSAFILLDKDSVLLTFQASSSSNDVATVNISGNYLTVQPISRGNAVITVSANDGFGRMVTTQFTLTVLAQKLEWPLDERLVLLYQSNDVFYLYSKQEKRIWYVRSSDIESMVYYGLVEVF